MKHVNARRTRGLIVAMVALGAVVPFALTRFTPSMKFVVGTELPESRLQSRWTVPTRSSALAPAACALLRNATVEDGLGLIVEWPGLRSDETVDWARTLESLRFFVSDTNGKLVVLQAARGHLGKAMGHDTSPLGDATLFTLRAGALDIGSSVVPWQSGTEFQLASGKYSVRVAGEFHTSMSRQPFGTEGTTIEVGGERGSLALSETERGARAALGLLKLSAPEAGQFLYEGVHGERVFTFDAWGPEGARVNVNLAVDRWGGIASAAVGAFPNQGRPRAATLLSDATAFTCR